MFILPPNCIVPSATSLTISPVFPNFLYFISHTPSAANENCDSKSANLPEFGRGFETVSRSYHSDIRPRVGCTSSQSVAPKAGSRPHGPAPWSKFAKNFNLLNRICFAVAAQYAPCHPLDLDQRYS